MRPSTPSPRTSPHAAIAPALISGFIGAPVWGRRLIALKASPDGSTPILASTASSPRSASARPYVNGLLTDWIVNGCRGVAHFVDDAVARRDADAEPFGVGMGELGDVVGERTRRVARVARMQVGEVGVDRRCGRGRHEQDPESKQRARGLGTASSVPG